MTSTLGKRKREDEDESEYRDWVISIRGKKRTTPSAEIKRIRQILEPQRAYVKNLSKEGKDALKRYAKHWDELIAYYLVHGEIPPDRPYTPDYETVSKTVHDTVMLLDVIFQNIPPLTEDIYVYRGMWGPYETRPKFTSTTISYQTAVGFAGVDGYVYRIKVVKGTRVLPFNVAENEVILNRSGYLRIIHGSEFKQTINVFQDVYRTFTHIDALYIDANIE